MGAGVRVVTAHCVLHLVISPTKQRGYDLLRALGSATGDITHETGVRFVTGIGLSSCDITHEKGVRLVTSIGFCVL